MRQASASVLAAIQAEMFPAENPRLTIYAPAPVGTLVLAAEATPSWEMNDLKTGSALEPATAEIWLGRHDLDPDTLRGCRVVVELLIGAEALVLFDGHVTSTDRDTEGTTVLADGPLAVADRRRGVLEVGLTCPYTFGDTDCGATVQTITVHAAAGCTTTSLVLSDYSESLRIGDELVSGGVVLARYRSRLNANSLSLDQPLAAAPAVGTALTFRMVCAKTLTDCRTRHANAARCGACPFRPVDD